MTSTPNPILTNLSRNEYLARQRGPAGEDEAARYEQQMGQIVRANQMRNEFGPVLGPILQFGQAAADVAPDIAVAIATKGGNGGQIMARRGTARRGPGFAEGRLYEVGLAKNLRKNPVEGTEVNHAPQSGHARSLIGDWNGINKAGNEPAIRLPESEHTAVSQAQNNRTRTPASAREALADEIRILRKYTEAPISAMKRLIQQNKDSHEADYRPVHRE